MQFSRESLLGGRLLAERTSRPGIRFCSIVHQTTARPADPDAASYRGLFAHPVLRRLAVADVCARLPRCPNCSSPRRSPTSRSPRPRVALIAYVRHHHALWASGPLLAGVSIGSILGSLFLGTRAHRLAAAAAVAAALSVHHDPFGPK